MNRIAGIDQERIDYWRQLNLDEAQTQDNDLPPEDRRTRADVYVGTVLKRDDDIMISDVIPSRIIGPARGRTSVICYYPEWFGDQPQAFDIETATWITDRAPFDAQETPMPVIVEVNPNAKK